MVADTVKNHQDEEELSDPGETDDENEMDVTLAQFTVSVLGSSHNHQQEAPPRTATPGGCAALTNPNPLVGGLSTPIATRQQDPETCGQAADSVATKTIERSTSTVDSADDNSKAQECSSAQKIAGGQSTRTVTEGQESLAMYSDQPHGDPCSLSSKESTQMVRDQIHDRIVVDLCDDDNPVSVKLDSQSRRSDDIPLATDELLDSQSRRSDDVPLASDELIFPCSKEVDNSKPQPAVTPSPMLNPDKEDVCFICGANLRKLSGFKGRLNHIKRCSKKHGVSGRDVRVDDDIEAFVETKAGAVSNSSQNPYHSLNAKWHGGKDTESAVVVASTTAAKQTTMKAFLRPAAPPVRSLNSVLLANARKMASMGSDKASTSTRMKPMSNNTSKDGKKQRGRLRHSTYSCPNYKRIPSTDFICDGFHYAKPSLSKHYFLSHFHSDHYGGINKSWNHGVIYCSLPTANLVHQQLGVDKRYLHPLPMNTPTVVTSGNGRPVSVTLFDANHCPGAVMFLFEIGKRRILHVGDFRWNKEAMLAHHALRSFATLQVRLNELFLDTTYCDPKYDLPTQAQAIEAAMETVLREVEHARRTKQRVLFLFGAYTIGKERIYLSVAERLNCKVYVERTRYRILSALEWPKEVMSRFTTVKDDTNLWVVPIGHINFKKMPEYVGSNSTKVFGKRRLYDRVVGFRPTGWALTAAAKQGSIISRQTSGPFTVCGVPYSEHSSFPELVDCIATLKPVKIVPTVSASTSQAQVELLLNYVREKQCETLLGSAEDALPPHSLASRNSIIGAVELVDLVCCGLGE